MPLTPYQERIRQLFAGNPLATRQLPEATGQQEALSPTQYNSPQTTNAATDAMGGEMPLLTQGMQTPGTYQDAVRRRFTQITGMGEDATNRQAQAAAYAASQVAPTPEVYTKGGYQY